MSFRFDTSLYFTGSSNPQTANYTCGAAAKLLVLDFGTEITAGNVGRRGAVPTYGGIPFYNVCTSAGSGGEAIIEMFALENPSHGSAYQVSIPNAGSITLNCHLSSYNTSYGYTAKIDSSIKLTSSSGAISPSTNVVTSVANELIVSAEGNGSSSTMVACYPGDRITPFLDKGLCQNEAQWDIIPTATTTRVGFTNATTPGISGLVTGWWKEIAYPVPGVPVLSTPKDNSLNIPIDTLLTWSRGSADTSSYGIQLSSSTGFILNDVSVINENDTSISTSGLLNSTNYYWKVKALNEGGYSAYSTPFKFTTIAGAAAQMWGGVLKIWDGANWTECPSNGFKIWNGSNWKYCPSTSFKIFRGDIDSSWYPIRMQGGVSNPELVTNGNFDSSVNWALYQNTIISGGVCTFNTANIYTTLLNQAITDISSGPVFTIQFDICTYTAGFVRFCLGNTTLGNNTPTFSAKGHYSFDLSVNNPAITPEITFFDDDTPGSQMVIDNVSVKVK